MIGCLWAAGAEEYVLDLRGNPGGSVQSAVGVAGLLLDESSVVTYIQVWKHDTMTSELGRCLPPISHTATVTHPGSPLRCLPHPHTVPQCDV
jgi:hypothetical protein